MVQFVEKINEEGLDNAMKKYSSSINFKEFIELKDEYFNIRAKLINYLNIKEENIF